MVARDALGTAAWWTALARAWSTHPQREVLSGLGTFQIGVTRDDDTPVLLLDMVFDDTGAASCEPVGERHTPSLSGPPDAWDALIQGDYGVIAGVVHRRLVYTGRLEVISPYLAGIDVFLRTALDI